MHALSQLEALTRAKQWLDSYRPLPQDIVRELDERFTVRLTHHSTAIEGNTLTQSETQIVLEKGVTIGGKSVAEHLEVTGHRDALAWVIELVANREALTDRTIRELHSLVMKGQANGSIGAYRLLNVMAAGTEHRYPDHLHIAELMSDFVSWWNTTPDTHPVIWASHAHLKFVSIHPFQDGNGRVGRLLLNLALLQAGYPIAVIPVQRRAEYIEALVRAQAGGDPTMLDELVIDAVEASMREVLEVCVTALPSEAKEEILAWLAS